MARAGERHTGKTGSSGKKLPTVIYGTGRDAMSEAHEEYFQRRLLSREEAGHTFPVVTDTIELRYQICLLFKALGKQEKYKALRGVCDDPSWLMQQFTGMLGVPKYELIKTCMLDDMSDNYGMFSFHPLIYEGKLYSKSLLGINVMDCNDDRLITTLPVSMFSCERITSDGKLCSVTRTGEVNIWDCNTDTLIKTHRSSTLVLCIITSDDVLYCGVGGSGECSISAWNCSNGDFIANLGDIHDNDRHTECVTCLAVHDGKLYSGSEDKSIKVWNCSNNHLIKDIECLPNPAQGLYINDGKLYAKCSGIIKVYDCSDYRLIATVEDDGGYISCVEFYGGKLYAGCRNGLIKVYDCSDHSLIAGVVADDGVEQLTIQNGKLYAMDCEGDIYIWQL